MDDGFARKLLRVVNAARVLRYARDLVDSNPEEIPIAWNELRAALDDVDSMEQFDCEAALQDLVTADKARRGGSTT